MTEGDLSLMRRYFDWVGYARFQAKSSIGFGLVWWYHMQGVQSEGCFCNMEKHILTLTWALLLCSILMSTFLLPSSLRITKTDARFCLFPAYSLPLWLSCKHASPCLSISPRHEPCQMLIFDLCPENGKVCNVCLRQRENEFGVSLPV